MFPQISGIENIAFFKSRYGYLAMNIEAVPFNLYRWLCILIYHMNTLIKL